MRRSVIVASATALAAVVPIGSAGAQEVVKLGLSAPMSGAGALWGKGLEFLCNKAAAEVRTGGGIKVKGKTYNVECLAYDNKYNASEGAKVVQTLLNRDGVRYVFGFGTAAILAAQVITERQGAMLFNTSWGMSSKGPKFPLTFSVNNTPVEITPILVRHVTEANPQAKTIALINVNDASGRESEAVYRPAWEKAGVKVLTSDFYERGTTEFQPIANRIASLKPDIVDIGSAPPADAGQIFKELSVLGLKSVKVMDNGANIDGLMATGGSAVDGVYMGFAMTFDGPSTTEHQRKVNDEARGLLGESLGMAVMGAYDAVYMMKAGMEKAQSIEPKDVAAVLPSIRYRTFLGGETGFGGRDVYGADIAPILPVYISQVDGGKIVERQRVMPKAP